MTNLISFVDQDGDPTFTIKLTDAELDSLVDIWKSSCCSFAPIQYKKIDKDDHTLYTATVKDSKSAARLERFIRTNIDIPSKK